MDNDEPNSLGVKIPAYAVVGQKAAQEFGWGRLSAAINNLIEEQYYTYAVYPLPGRTLSPSVELQLD